MIRAKSNNFSGVVIWAVCAACAFLFSASVNAQSADQAFPTAITENLVSGVIKARDVGDPRVTTFYYTFNGRQGDLFVNVVTKNLSGSVDIFATDGMRTLTNIVVYADVAQNETGRVVYLRKPERLILRVQGRTPNDDPAEFQIKFAGGFEAATPTTDEPPVPKVTDLGENDSGVKVNSVGTIIAVIPKPKPTPKAEAAETAKTEEKTDEPAKADVEKVEKQDNAETKTADSITETKTDEKAATKVKQPDRVAAKRSTPKARAQKPKATEGKIEPTGEKNATSEGSEKSGEPEKEAKGKLKVVVTDAITKSDETGKAEPPAAKTDPLANVNLVILFKDGTKVQRPMTQVLRFTVDQKTLTVVSTNGRIAKFSILEVASVTIQ